MSWIADVINLVKGVYDTHGEIRDAADPENYEVALYNATAERRDEQSQLDSLQSQLDTAEVGTIPLNTPRSKYAAYGLDKVPILSFGNRIASNIDTDTQADIGKQADIEFDKAVAAAKAEEERKRLDELKKYKLSLGDGGSGPTALSRYSSSRGGGLIGRLG